MRHSRSAEFSTALAAAQQPQPALRWSALSEDPNAAIVLARRAETLRAAWRPPIEDRLKFLEDRCRNRVVMDIGCVAHDVERMSSPNWLHGRLAAAARRCIGVDVLDDGVEAMRQLGYEVELHDLGSGLGPLAAHAPFDVIVAGELIEHVESLDMLFKAASMALADDGELIITTPNPYAPHRVRAGQLGIVWENVDHIVYAFPSGIAELAERHGLVLAEAATVEDTVHRSATNRLRAIRRRLRGRQFLSVGFSSTGDARQQRVRRRPLWLFRRMQRSKPSFLGETFVYVVARSVGTVYRSKRSASD